MLGTARKKSRHSSASSHHDHKVFGALFPGSDLPRYVKYRIHYRSVDARFIAFSAPKLYVLPSPAGPHLFTIASYTSKLAFLQVLFAVVAIPFR